MRRRLLRSSAFVRAAKRRVRKDPRVAEDIRAALELLAEDAFHPQLRTHKLKGKLIRAQLISEVPLEIARRENRFRTVGLLSRGFGIFACLCAIKRYNWVRRCDYDTSEDDFARHHH